MDNKLIAALRSLVEECETNTDFATEYESERDALNFANEALAEHEAGLEDGQVIGVDTDGCEIVWDAETQRGENSGNVSTAFAKECHSLGDKAQKILRAAPPELTYRELYALRMLIAACRAVGDDAEVAPNLYVAQEN